MDEILELLEKDAKLTPKQIASMTKKNAKKVADAITKYEKNGVILRYKAVINRDLIKADEPKVTALIEARVAPQKNVGFESVAERIYKFPEVISCYLLSGSYDLLLIVEGKSIHTVSNFVSEKLSPLENVRSTVTHFLLKKYKEDGDMLRVPEKDKRMKISF